MGDIDRAQLRPGPSKRQGISLAEKERIIAEVDRNPQEKKINIAKRLNIPTSTLHTILAQREKIKNCIDKCGPNMAKSRKSNKKSPYEELETALLAWFQQARASNIPVNGIVLREKAAQIAIRFHIETFTASNGWIDRFKKRHGLSYKTVSGEADSVDLDVVEKWKSELPAMTEDYEDRDIYNADETGMFYNLLPVKSLTYAGEVCHGGKCSKERLTALLCTNKDGSHKLPALIIGKAKNPRCFKNNRKQPAKYIANKNAWMTAVFFGDWLKEFDAKMGSKNRKIILFIDRCPAHPSDMSFLRNMKVVFFPPNCTSHLQPLDMGIIRCVKQLYRKQLVRQVVAMMDRGDTITKIRLDVLKAMHFIVSAWNDVKTTTIVNCFRKCGYTQESEDEVEMDIDIVDDSENDDDISREWSIVTGGQQMSFEDFVTFDDNVATCGLQSLEAICEETRPEENESDDADDSEEPPPPPSFRDALAGFEMAKQFILSYDVDDSAVRDLHRTERLMFQLNQRELRKQTRVSDFFKVVQRE